MVRHLHQPHDACLNSCKRHPPACNGGICTDACLCPPLPSFRKERLLLHSHLSARLRPGTYIQDSRHKDSSRTDDNTIPRMVQKIIMGSADLPAHHRCMERLDCLRAVLRLSPLHRRAACHSSCSLNPACRYLHPETFLQVCLPHRYTDKDEMINRYSYKNRQTCIKPGGFCICLYLREQGWHIIDWLA